MTSSTMENVPTPIISFLSYARPPSSHIEQTPDFLVFAQVDNVGLCFARISDLLCAKQVAFWDYPALKVTTWIGGCLRVAGKSKNESLQNEILSIYWKCSHTLRYHFEAMASLPAPIQRKIQRTSEKLRNSLIS